MKKLIATVFMLILLCPLLFGETSIFLGGIYDSYNGNDWGFEGSIDSDFMKNASLSAAIDYRYDSNYSMSFTADYKPLFFLIYNNVLGNVNHTACHVTGFSSLQSSIGQTFARTI